MVVCSVNYDYLNGYQKVSSAGAGRQYISLEK